MKTVRKCPVCGTDVKGRSDKIYCNVYCKNENHYKVRQKRLESILPVDDRLHHNYKLLCQYLQGKNRPVKVSKAELTELNFNFDFHTHFITNAKGQIYRCLYNLAWLQLSDNVILVVKTEVPKIE